MNLARILAQLWCQLKVTTSNFKSKISEGKLRNCRDIYRTISNISDGPHFLLQDTNFPFIEIPAFSKQLKQQNDLNVLIKASARKQNKRYRKVTITRYKPSDVSGK